MKALSIRQPWAWLIMHAGKDVENRSWPTRLRGRILVHAAKGMTRLQYEEGKAVLASINPEIVLPPADELERGGIAGSVRIIGCVQRSLSPWFFGPYGFALQNPEPLTFTPMKGRLGFFDVQDIGIQHAG